jgi:hypothetical protein
MGIPAKPPHYDCSSGSPGGCGESTLVLIMASPFLAMILLCGGCELTYFLRHPERQEIAQLKDQLRRMAADHEEAMRRAETARESALRVAEEQRRKSLPVAAIGFAKQALTRQEVTQIADDMSANQDAADPTRWTVRGHALVEGRLQEFAVTLRHVTFQGANHWEPDSVEVADSLPTPCGKPSDRAESADPALRGSLDDLFGPPRR